MRMAVVPHLPISQHLQATTRKMSEVSVICSLHFFPIWAAALQTCVRARLALIYISCLMLITNRLTHSIAFKLLLLDGLRIPCYLCLALPNEWLVISLVDLSHVPSLCPYLNIPRLASPSTLPTLGNHHPHTFVYRLSINAFPNWLGWYFRGLDALPSS